MNVLAGLFLVGLALPAAACSVYLLLLTLCSGALASPRSSSRKLRFDVVIPAHDEAENISAVVASVRSLDWPQDGFRILVVADNCTDHTAALARLGGARVLERNDTVLRGKGHALACAFNDSRDAGWADAVVVVDADTKVSANFLESFAARILRPDMVLQAHYRVLNADASWRTRLLAIGLGAFHRLRSRARERMGLSCGLRGNGWCITHDLLRRVPYGAHSLAEDVEYGIVLGLAGYRVQYVDEASASALMVPGERASRSQRHRWEAGRLQLKRTLLWPLLRGTGNRQFAVRADLAMDLLVPPLSYVVLNVAALLLLAAVLATGSSLAVAGLWCGVGCLFCIALYTLRGWQLSDTGAAGLVALLYAPFFVLWKLFVVLVHRGSGEWVRTRREAP